MRKQTFMKSTLCLLMALVCNVAWAAVLPTEPIKASQNLPTMGIPEYQFYVRGTKSDGQYWNSSTINTNNVNSAGKFAFYAVPGLADCYYIYSVDAKKWVNYNKTNRNNQKSFVEVADNFDANAYWKITMATKKSDNTSCYQMQPTVYTTKQSGVLNIKTDRYANWYQGADGSSTLGLWEQSPSVDEGSAWSLVAVDVAEDLNAQLARRVALANKVIALEATYTKGQGLLTSDNVTSIISSPYTSTQEGSIAKLVDGSAGVTNHWHSDYSKGDKINGSHYIVANLGEQTPENLSFVYKRRNGAADDQTTRWAVYGVPADETGVLEDSRAGLTLLAVISTPLTNANDVFENLPPFKTKGFKKFRIYADATNQNRGYFHIGEMQLYGNTLADSNTDAMKELAAALATAEGVENATQNDIDALNEKLSAFIASEESIAAAREALACEGIGYPTANNAQRLALQEILNNDDVIKSALDAAVAAYKSSADIVLPEDGKAYTFTALFQNGNKLYMKYVNGQKVSLSATPSDASTFVCKKLRDGNGNGVYAFITADGKILTWVGKDDNKDFYKENEQYLGYSSNYATVYKDKSDWNDITVKKNDTHVEQFGLLRMVGRRNTTGTTSSSFYANKGGGFEQAGDGNLFNDTNTSGWIFTEVTHTNTLAQDLALAKIDAKIHVTANADKLGNGIGCAYYVVNGEKKYTAADVNAAIDDATTIDVVNAIKNSYVMTLPEFGKAYTMTLVANNNEKTQYKIIATDGTLEAKTEGENSVFYCLQSNSNDYPYIFVSEDGYVMGYKSLVQTYVSTDNRHNFMVGAMVDKTSNITSSKADRLGMVYLTTAARNPNDGTGGIGCLTIANSNGGWSNSDAPYHNGSHTSAIVMTEQDINTLTDAQVAKADEILGRTALKEQVEGLRGQLKNQVGYYYCTINGVKMYDADAILAAINAASSAATVAEIAAAVNAKTPVLPEYGKTYKMAFKTKEGALHHIVANDATLALSASTEEKDASVFYCMQSSSADYPYIFVSAQGGFLTFKALSDAYISRVTDFKVGLMVDVANNVNSTVDARLGTVYITTNKRPGSTDDTDGCFVFKNQDNANTYDGADVPFHNDNFTSAIVMTEVAAESKTVYNIAVEGNADAKANAYVAYDNGNVVRRAFNEGFFVTNGAITEAQLKAGFVGNAVKSATITMAGNAITLSDVVTFPTPVKQDLYNTSNGALGIPPYRIPGITVDPETGRIITTAARLVCGTDPGYGQVDVVCRISDDNGENWSGMKEVAVGTGITSPEENYFDTAFGDPAVVADRTSDEVLIIVVAGCTKYQTATRTIPNEIGTIHSKDNGETWEEPVRVTEDIYSLFDAVNGGNPIESAFVGGGKIFQSRIVKVGKYYRLYAAMCARPNGNRVIYSDDFGRTWYALGGASALPAPGGDEPKCEEMPDGRVILSSRTGGGRIYNIYTYTNTATAEGSWEGAVTSTFEGSGKIHNGQSTNGEILIVPVQRNSDQKDMYLVLQSLPAGGGRSHVGIFYKELTDLSDINNVANFAIDWNGYFEVTSEESAYSSMDLQNDDRIGFIYEEDLVQWGTVPNPHSIPFPDANNLGTHNYDGYDNIYVAYPLEIITNGAYSIKRSVNRRTYVSNYFTALTEDASDEMKAKMTTALNALSAEPTIAEVDKLNLIAAAAQETEGTWYCFRMEEKRSGGSVPQNSWGYISDNLTATATPVKSGSYLWQKIDAGEGKFHLKSMNGKYLVPATNLTTSTEQPTAAWTFEESATKGKDVIFNGDVPCQLHVYKNGNLANWGWNSSGTGARKDDDGCKFVFVEASTMTDVLDNLYEFDADAGKVGYYADATIATYKSAIWSAMLPEQITAAKTAVTSSTVWNMPVSGKAYTFKNVQKDGTTVCWFKYDANAGNITTTTIEAEATPFVCRLLENGKYVLMTSEGKYMTWRGSDNGNTGVRDAYDATADAYTDVTISKMTTGSNITGNLSNTRYINIYARRNSSSDGCVVIAKNGLAFDKSGAPYYNDNHSSAIIMEEAAFGNTPKVNGVGVSGLMSEDLHGKHMSTFSATYATVAPEGVTAYYATKDGEYVVLNAVAEDEAIPANTGVILVSEEGGNAVMLPAAGETAADVTDNLMGHSAGAPKDMSSVADAYILTGGEQGAGFYRCSGGTLAANKAYLVLPQPAGVNAPSVRIRLAGTQGGTPTEVEGSELKAQGSQLIYDLQGRRVLNPTKGMYIVNGKKVIF